MNRIIIGLLLSLFLFGTMAEAREAQVSQSPHLVVENANLASSVFADNAYTILEGLATKRRNQRVFGGLSAAAGGLITGLILGASLGVVSEEAAFYGFWVPTGIGVVIGGITLLIPTEPEREFSDVQDLAPGAQAAASADALQRLSEKAYVGRMVNVAITAASAFASFLLPQPNEIPYTRVIGFASGIGSAVLTFLIPTEEERAYQRYLRLSDA
jgi:hypothetical protein